jgi:hypothetical protein
MDAAAKQDEIFSKRVRAYGFALMTLDRIMKEERANGMRISRIIISGPGDGRDGFLATIKARDEAGKLYVAFRGAEDADTLIASIVEGVENDGLKWKDDKPWTPQEAAAKGRVKKT